MGYKEKNCVLLIDEKGALLSKWWWRFGEEKRSIEEKLVNEMFAEGFTGWLLSAAPNVKPESV